MTKEISLFEKKKRENETNRFDRKVHRRTHIRGICIPYRSVVDSQNIAEYSDAASISVCKLPSSPMPMRLDAFSCQRFSSPLSRSSDDSTIASLWIMNEKTNRTQIEQ